MGSQTNEAALFSSNNTKLPTPLPKLIGYAELPADTFAEGPPSGSALANPTNGRPTPFSGQPVQGFSGVQFSKGGYGKNLLFLSDNGYGALGNSADYLLRIQELDPDFRGSETGNGSVKLNGYIQLSDPNKKVPFKIVHENTSERLLTGADFDVESIVVAPNGDLWIGDEFGPYLLHFNSEGKLLDAPYATPNSIFGSRLSTLAGASPIVIGHRGASGELPEHTLEGYRLAILRGADFIEPDLVSTKDGQLIARHEPNLINTTDVGNRPEFASRKTTKFVDGVAEEGFFASDFTLAEVKTLRAVMPQGFRTQAFNGTFEIPTFNEIIDLVNDIEIQTGKKIGIYPETKHPTYHDQLGLSLEEKLLAVLKGKNFVDPSRIFIQSFEVSNLKELSASHMPAAGVKLPLVQLLDAYDVDNNGVLIYEDVNAKPYDFTVRGDTRTYTDLQTPAGLAEIATYANGIGPWKPMILSTKTVDGNEDGKPDDLNGDGVVNGQDRILGTPSSLVADAHAKGLFVHAYTFRNEPRYLASSYANNPQAEYATFYKLGVDGLFSDFPGTADHVRDQLGEVRSPQNPIVRVTPEFQTLRGQPPIVIGHRGDSGHRPEHTLASYKSAIAKGADFIEPDLVITKDNVLIARHEPMLAVVRLDANGAILRDGNGNPILNTTDTSTDVYKHQEFAIKLTVKNLDGVLKGGWFAEDFTLAEIKQLNAIERIPAIRGTKYDNEGLKIPTLAEVINLVKQIEADTGRKIGIYPETKHPSYFLKDGRYADGITVIKRDTSQMLVNTLKSESFTDPSRVFIQSFEVDNLQRLNSVIMPAAGIDIPLIQLFGGSGQPYDFLLSGDSRTYDDLSTVAGLAAIKSYAEGIGPNKARILPMSFQDANGDGKRDDLNGDGQISDADTLVGKPTSLVSDAHKAGLFVHLYTLRDDSYFLPSSYNGVSTKEYQAFIDLGVDGFFTDFPDTGNAVLASRYLAGYGIGTAHERFGEQISPNLGASGGFEGMAASPDGKTLYPLLEKTVSSDISGSLRIYTFDVATQKYTGLTGYYRMEKSTHAIGEITPINNHEFIVIERDGTEGSEQGFKKLFKIDVNKKDVNGFVAKEEIVNLMAIDDPNDLNKDGKAVYNMPFVTIEDVLVLNENSVLVANDNNYPFSKGRPPAIDNNEIVTIQLSQPLDLDPLLGMGTPGLTPKPTIPWRLQLLHLSDGEAGLLASETAPYLAALIDGFDGTYANTLILAGGDNFIPSPFLNGGTDLSVRDELNTVTGSSISLAASVNHPIAAVDIAIHNVIGVEASTIGNHEFDLGARVFRDAFSPGTVSGVSGWVGAQFPYLSANLDFSGDGDLNPRYTNTSATAGLEDATTLKGRIVPSAVVIKNGEKIGLVGATTQVLEQIASPGGVEVKGFAGDGSERDDMAMLASQLQPVIDDLTAQGVNKVILMAHLQQIANEKALAPLLRGVDIILSAGSNTRLGDSNDQAVAFPGHAANFADNYPLVSQGADGAPTLIVNTDNEYTYLGRLVVDFDAQGRILPASVDPLVSGAYAATAANVARAWNVTEANLVSTAFAKGTKGVNVQVLTDAVQSVINSKDGQVWGYSTVYQEGERALVRGQETNLGNLTADANLAYAKSVDPSVVLSLKNGGGIRSQIGSIDVVSGEKKPTAANPSAGKPEGGISTLDIENSLRFNNSLSLVTVTASKLRDLLEHGVAIYPNQGRFPQVSGVAFSFDPTRPAGSRISNLSIEDATGKDLDLIVRNGTLYGDPNRTFRMVTLNFLAGGGDGYPFPNDASANRVDLFNPSAAKTGAATFAGDGTEQDVLAEYLATRHATLGAALSIADTAAPLDLRVQNLTQRPDTVVDPATLSLRALSADKAEGNSGSTPYTFTIQREGDPSVAVSVAWAVTASGANAADALDFAGAALPSGPTTLAAGQTSQQITINIVGDGSFEANESFSLSLSNPVGGILLAGAATANGRIQNDDAPSPPSYTFSKSAEAVDEGSSLAIGVSTANVPAGSPLYWRFSGAGITAADFSDGLLEGSTVLGIDGRAAFSKAIAADAANDPNETLELRFYSDTARSQQVGSTVSVLLKQPSVGVITDDSDGIIGSSVAQTLIGVPTGSTLRGRGSLDRLTGGGGDDLFVLGDAAGRFYADGTNGLGSADLALITDFNSGDRIQLHGLASDYRLISGRYGGVAGVRIDAASPTPEAIGFVQGAALASLNLANSSQFLFV